MKDKKSFSLLLVVLFLIGIGVVVATGFWKNKKGEIKKGDTPNILGQTVQGIVEPTSSLNVDRFIQNTIQSTKEAAGQKVVEVQKTVLTTVEKEIATLTQSQVDALKLQICRDWGVAPTPTKAP